MEIYVDHVQHFLNYIYFCCCCLFVTFILVHGHNTRKREFHLSFVYAIAFKCLQFSTLLVFLIFFLETEKKHKKATKKSMLANLLSTSRGKKLFDKVHNLCVLKNIAVMLQFFYSKTYQRMRSYITNINFDSTFSILI